MSIKRSIFISIGISLLFFMIGWICTPFLLEYMTSHLVRLAKEVTIVSVSIQQQFTLRFWSAASLAMIPVWVMLVTLAIQRFKKKGIANWDYFFYFSIILTVYLLAAVFKFYALEATVTEVLNHPIKSSVKTVLPLGQVQVYDWAFYGSAIAAVLIALIAKRKKGI